MHTRMHACPFTSLYRTASGRVLKIIMKQDLVSAAPSMTVLLLEAIGASGMAVLFLECAHVSIFGAWARGCVRE